MRASGASGWIGSAVVPELIGADHQALSRARSDTAATALRAAGAQVHRGDLDDLDSLRSGAAMSDGVIHPAFKHDIAFSGDFQGAAGADRRVVETFGEVLAGSDRASGVAPANCSPGSSRSGQPAGAGGHGRAGAGALRGSVGTHAFLWRDGKFTTM